MYFSKKMQKIIMHRIRAGAYKIYDLKLSTGLYAEDEVELKSIVNTMFLAWRIIVSSRSRGFITRFKGIMRRLFFEYSKERGGFSPYFHLLCIYEFKINSDDEMYKMKLEEEKTKLKMHINWLSAWVTALKICTEAPVKFSIVDFENLEKVISEFCTNEKYSVLAIVDETKKMLLKNACSNHRLVSFHGVFKNLDLNRHVTVQR